MATLSPDQSDVQIQYHHDEVDEQHTRSYDAQPEIFQSIPVIGGCQLPPESLPTSSQCHSISASFGLPVADCEDDSNDIASITTIDLENNGWHIPNALACELWVTVMPCECSF